MGILDDIGAVLSSPEVQRGFRGFSQIGMPLDLVQRQNESFLEQDKLDMLQQQKMQEMQREQVASRLVASIMQDGKIDSEKLAALAQFDPEAAMRLYKTAQQTMQPVTLPDGTVLGYDKYTNTLTPTNMSGQGASMGSGENWQTSFEQPVNEMVGLSPRGRVELEKAKIQAIMPPSPKEQAQIDLDERRVKAMEAGNEREQQRAGQEQKTIENQNKTLLNFLDKKEAAIDRLFSPKSGLTSATGFIQSKLPTISQSTREAEKDLDQIRGLETLDAASMNILKGVLSDTDMALLRAASSGALDLERGDATVINELKRIKNEIAVAKQRLTNNSQPAPQSQSSDPLGIR